MNSRDESLIEPYCSVIDGWALFNLNCHDYLSYIATKVTPAVLHHLPCTVELKKTLLTSDNKLAPYNESISYGNLYHSFMYALQNDIAKIADYQKHQWDVLHHYKEPSHEIIIDHKKINISNDYYNIEMIQNEFPELDAFIISIYENPNKALERSGEFAHLALGEESIISGSKAKGKIYNKSRGMLDNVSVSEDLWKRLEYRLSFFSSQTNPAQQESKVIRGYKTFVASTFQPQLTTSIPSNRWYEFFDKMNCPWIEYRFGTQGEYVNNVARINPLFTAFLEAKARKYFKLIGENKPFHIYFNNLGLDRVQKGSTDIAGKEGVYERKLSLELHHLESTHPGIIVITLPADKGLMGHDMSKNNVLIDTGEALETIKNIIVPGSSLDAPENLKDFYISSAAKRLIYGLPKHNNELYDHHNENVLIENLLTKSIYALGFHLKPSLTGAELQALYFHFLKYELTNYIIQQVDPISINFACKDAIDRGNVASLYFNLLTSIKNGVPMSEKDFNVALHGAPTLVKGRGVNDHLDRVWKPIMAYMDGQVLLKQDKIPDWLIRMKKEYMIEPVIDEVHHAFLRLNQRGSINAGYSNFGKVMPDEMDEVNVYRKIKEDCLAALAKIIDNPENLTSESLTKEMIKPIDDAIDVLKSIRIATQQGTHVDDSTEIQLEKIKDQLLEMYAKVIEDKTISNMRFI